MFTRILNLPKNIFKLFVIDIKIVKTGVKNGKIKDNNVNGYKNKLIQGTKIKLIKIDNKLIS